jgi:Ni/Co efflux regulator RcnB
MFAEAPPEWRVQEATMNRTLTRALGAIALGTLLLQPVTAMADPPAHARNEHSAKYRGGGGQGDYYRDGRHDDRHDDRYDHRSHYDGDHAYGSGRYYYPRRGHVVHYLPPRPHVVHYHGNPYYYAGGAWYRPFGPDFVVVTPPIGLVFSFAPQFQTTVYFGGMPYYQAGPVYYAWPPKKRGYVVVDGPY